MLKTTNAVTFLFLMVAAGCSQSLENDPDASTSKGELVEVTGTVMLDGSPLGNAFVRFEPDSGTKGTMSWGLTDSSGSFRLQKNNNLQGCHVGRHKVTVSKFARKDGTPLPKDVDGATAAAEGMEHLPPRYSDLDQTELSFDVPKEGKKFEIVLKTK